MSQSTIRPTTARCSVTGAIVPEDELITFQGQRVCAHGKEILLARLESGESLPGELESPRPTRRFVCFVFDFLLFWLFSVIIRQLAGLAAGHLGAFANGPVVVIPLCAVQLAYYAVMHSARGQTVAKIAGRIQVVNLDGSPITRVTAWIRAFAYIGPMSIGASILSVTDPNFLASQNPGRTTLLLTMLPALWLIGDAMSALLDQAHQQALHDRIARTRVVVIW